MNEGWYNNEYLVIFSQAESSAAAERYKLDRYLPGYTLVGLRGWDDFIVVSPAGGMCSLPTVPADVARAESFTLSASVALQPDARLTGKIKWYVKPLIFGGEPNDKENISWVTLEQHAELAVWWNEQYKKLKAQAAGA